MIFDEPRKYSAMTETDCELLWMPKTSFTKIFFHEFKDIGSEIYNNALKRRLRNRTAYKEALAYCQAKAQEQAQMLEKGKIKQRTKSQDILAIFNKSRKASTDPKKEKKSSLIGSLFKNISKSRSDDKPVLENENKEIKADTSERLEFDLKALKNNGASDSKESKPTKTSENVTEDQKSQFRKLTRRLSTYQEGNHPIFSRTPSI